MASRNLPHIAGRDIAYCYSCHNEWYHPSGDASALRCALCQSDCIELVSQSDGNDPRSFLLPTVPPFAASARAGPSPVDIGHFGLFRHPVSFNLHRERLQQQHDREELEGRRESAHDDDEDDSDPDVADIEEQEFHDPGNYDMYRSTFTFTPGRSTHQQDDRSTASHRQRGSEADHGPSSSASGQRPQVTDPSDPASIISSFTNFITGYRDSLTSRPGGNSSNDGESHSRSRTTRTSDHDHAHRTTSVRFPGGATAFTIATGPITIPPRGRVGSGGNVSGSAAGGPFGDFESFFSNIMADTAPPQLGGEHRDGHRDGNDMDAADGLPPDLPAAMHHILLSLLHQPHGDVVHTNEAMDLVMSMLMDTNPGSGAAPPATQQALDQLERKKIDAEMLGSEGSAECTICIAEVTLGEEVLSLSCKHWFHEECALMWLNQHNTCPVCRRPVEADGSTRGTRSEHESESNQASSQTGNSSGNNANSGHSANSATNNAQARGGAAAGSENTNPLNPNNYIVNGRFIMMNLSDLRNAATADGATTSASTRAASGDHSRGTASAGQNSQPGNDAGWPPILPPILRLRRPDPAAEQGQPWGQPWAWQTLWQQQQTDQQERARQHREQVRVEQQQAEQQHRDRLDAIRRTAGLPPNHYRSSRTPERAAAAERERRRRDSHSPNPGLNFPSRRYNNGAVPPISEDYWSRSEREPQSSDSRQRSPSSMSTGHYYWRIGGLDGSGDEQGRERFVDRYTRDRDRERQRERDRSRPDRLDRSRISSILNSEPTHSSAGTDWATSSYEHDPAPDEPGWAGPSSSPGTQGQHHGGDESTDGNRNGNSNSNSNSNGNGNGNGNGNRNGNGNSSGNSNGNGNGNGNSSRSGSGSGSGGGGGGFFGNFLRGLSGSGNNHQSSNSRGRS